MTYVKEWERLAEVLARVMATGSSRDQAQADICQAIADGTVKIRVRPEKHVTRLMRSKTILEGKDLHIPADLKSQDVDWERSVPLKPWAVRRDIFGFPGFWTLEWIEVSRTDVAIHLCCPERRGEPIEPALGVTPATNSGSVVESKEQKALGKGPARRRGKRPQKFEQTKNAMRSDIQQGRCTKSELANMLEKSLEARYGVSRDTARRARDAVLSEFSEH